jgi:predicted kinase
MKEFVMLKGAPGCGKSTWTKEYIKGKKDYIRINNDDLSTMLYGEPFTGGNKTIEKVRVKLIHDFMEKNVNIVIDNTNLHPKHVENYSEMVELYNAALKPGKEAYKFIIKDFTDIPLDTCLARNRKRDNVVPEHVIRKMYNDYIAVPTKYLEQDITLPKAIIVDIDGTVANIDHRNPFDQRAVYEDPVIPNICNLVKAMATAGYKIIFLSGRTENCRSDTLKWINDKAKLPCEILLLNKNGESRSSDITKEEIFNNYVKDKYSIACKLKKVIFNNEYNLCGQPMFKG